MITRPGISAFHHYSSKFIVTNCSADSTNLKQPVIDGVNPLSNFNHVPKAQQSFLLISHHIRRLHH